MFKCLSPGPIGIKGLALPETVALAQETGFEGVAFSIREASDLARAHGSSWARDLFDRAGIRPGTWGLPVAWNGAQEAWERDLAELPQLAALARELGCTGTSTWCLPASDERDFDENFAWHVARFRPIAEILRDHECRLGIEFIGPKTMRIGPQFSFIHTMDGMMQLAEAIGTDNVGLLLDAWHLYTSGGDPSDLDAITADDVVLLHINDAPSGIAPDEQIDQVRCMPMETGVIDLPALMRKLAAMGYVGPVVTEPFSERINEVAANDPVEAARQTSEVMDELWRASGLTAPAS